MEFLTNPDRFLRNVKENLDYKLPLLLVSLSGVTGGIKGYIIGDAMKRAVARMLIEKGLAEKEIQTALAFVQLSSVVTPIITSFVVWFLIAILIHAISSLFGGKGKFSTTLKLSAFSFIPNLIFFPLDLYLSFETARYMDLYGLEGFKHGFGLVLTIVGLFVLIWQFFYWIFIAKNARELDMKKATITAFVVFVLFLIPTAYTLLTKLNF